MLLALTLLPEQLRLNKTNNDGFSLLEVIVALAIMAMGFVTVLQLFSGSIRSVSLSEQYLKGTSLAHSKLGALEVNNYSVTEFEGTFPDEKKYRWELEVSPHTSPLNSNENNIQLSEVLLKVLWSDSNKIRNIELSTVKVNGELQPNTDSFLTQSFIGGPGNINQDNKEATEEATEETTPEASQNICGATTPLNSHVSGAASSHISGN